MLSKPSREDIRTTNRQTERQAGGKACLTAIQ
jgi:hypothetical protein